MPNLLSIWTLGREISLLSQGSFNPLSDGPSTRYHRITKPYCCTCSSRFDSQSSSLLPLHSSPSAIWPREGTFWAPPASFEATAPTTARLTLSRISLLSRLEFQYIKGGIPTSAPVRLASNFPSLPPILYVMYQNPMSGYSSLWVFSIQSRVTCIFTGISISLSSLRQCPTVTPFRAVGTYPTRNFATLDCYSYGRRSPGLQSNALD